MRESQSGSEFPRLDESLLQELDSNLEGEMQALAQQYYELSDRVREQVSKKARRVLRQYIVSIVRYLPEEISIPGGSFYIDTKSRQLYSAGQLTKIPLPGEIWYEQERAIRAGIRRSLRR